MCDHKKLYKRKAAAERECRKMKRYVVDPFRLQVYRCDRHNGWHIGNAPLPKLFNRYERSRRMTSPSPTR